MQKSVANPIGILPNTTNYSSIAHAESQPVYTDSKYIVVLTNSYKLDENHYDTDIEFTSLKYHETLPTHYEFIIKNDTWVFRTHLQTYGSWKPVNDDKIATSIFNYVYYNT